MRPRRTMCIAALALAVAALPAFAGLAEPPAPPDITVILRKANTLLHSKPLFRKAVLLEADGFPARTKARQAADITKWHLVYDNQPTGNRYRSVSINANKGKLGTPVGNPSPFLEDLRIPAVPRMTLTTAVKKLRAAGFRQAFYNVVLRKPLYPGVKEPYYIFGFGPRAAHPYVSVGTQSGKVKPIG